MTNLSYPCGVLAFLICFTTCSYRITQGRGTYFVKPRGKSPQLMHGQFFSFSVTVLLYEKHRGDTIATYSGSRESKSERKTKIRNVRLFVYIYRMRLQVRGFVLVRTPPWSLWDIGPVRTTRARHRERDVPPLACPTSRMLYSIPNAWITICRNTCYSESKMEKLDSHLLIRDPRKNTVAIYVRFDELFRD